MFPTDGKISHRVGLDPVDIVRGHPQDITTLKWSLPNTLENIELLEDGSFRDSIA